MRNERGLTLIEVMISMALMGFFITVLGTFAGKGMASVKSSEDKSTGYRILDELVEEMTALPITSPRLADGYTRTAAFDIGGESTTITSSEAFFGAKISVTESNLTTGVGGTLIKRKSINIEVIWSPRRDGATQTPVSTLLTSAPTTAEKVNVAIWR